MDRREIDKLLTLPLEVLVAEAGRVRRENTGPRIELCNIMNAKSGACSENCKFCAQSSHHSTAASTYPLKDKNEMLEAARRAKQMGTHRFDIVTSGNALSDSEIKKIVEAVRLIRSETGMKMCASLGSLTEAGLMALKDAGVSRYHHNIETSRRYFPQIVTTHSFQDRIDTIRCAKKAGLEVCSGGIIGMGEDWSDRIDMALTLAELGVDSVPLNMLVAIKGTCFEKIEPMLAADAIRTIAIFRIILKDKVIKIAAGRESVLKDLQALAFMAGANGMLIGGYLTIKGRSVEDDLAMAEEIERVW